MELSFSDFVFHTQNNTEILNMSTWRFKPWFGTTSPFYKTQTWICYFLFEERMEKTCTSVTPMEVKSLQSCVLEEGVCELRGRL